MIFTDPRFLFLFGCCWLSFAVVAPERRSAVLALWGSIFYAVYAGAWIVLVVALIAGAAFASRRSVAWLAPRSSCCSRASRSPAAAARPGAPRHGSSRSASHISPSSCCT